MIWSTTSAGSNGSTSGTSRGSPTHPIHLYVSEAHVLTLVAPFFRERVFGPNRKNYLRAADATTVNEPKPDGQLVALRRQLGEVVRGGGGHWRTRPPTGHRGA